MNSYCVNIRIGCWHYTIDFDYKCTRQYNSFHIGNTKKFAIYSFFGLEKTVLKMFNK